MAPTIYIKSKDDAATGQREATVRRVLACLRYQPLDRRLLCFLDDEDWKSFKVEAGVANRGFYSLVKPSDPHWQIAPRYILERVFVNGLRAFDDFIYLHGSTCSNDLGLTITLAHELQHFVQHAENASLWAANMLVPNLSKAAVKTLGLKWCDIPHEREARIVSKQIAEKLFGANTVGRFIDSKIAEFVTAEDAADWECIRGLDTSVPFDLANETGLFFPRLGITGSSFKEPFGSFRLLIQILQVSIWTRY